MLCIYLYDANRRCRMAWESAMQDGMGVADTVVPASLHSFQFIFIIFLTLILTLTAGGSRGVSPLSA